MSEPDGPRQPPRDGVEVQLAARAARGASCSPPTLPRRCPRPPSGERLLLGPSSPPTRKRAGGGRGERAADADPPAADARRGDASCSSCATAATPADVIEGFAVAWLGARGGPALRVAPAAEARSPSPRRVARGGRRRRLLRDAMDAAGWQCDGCNVDDLSRRVEGPTITRPAGGDSFREAYVVLGVDPTRERGDRRVEGVGPGHRERSGSRSAPRHTIRARTRASAACFAARSTPPGSASLTSSCSTATATRASRGPRARRPARRAGARRRAGPGPGRTRGPSRRRASPAARRAQQNFEPDSSRR